MISETLSKVLYPNDEPEVGQAPAPRAAVLLRLLLAAGHAAPARPQGRADRRASPDLFAAQLNDTHPSIAVAELMRLLVDERVLPWDEAWDITRRTLAYTNHTLLPEALETWGLPLFQQPAAAPARDHLRDQPPLPRRGPAALSRRRRARRADVADRRGRREARAHGEPGDRRQPRGQRRGRAALRRCCRQTVLRDFAELWPERFHNVTNGVTPRRFVVLSNPALARLLDETVGEGWVTDLSRLEAPRSARRRRGVPGPMARGSSARTRRRSRTASASAPASSSIRRRCSTSRSSASTSTSAST